MREEYSEKEERKILNRVNKWSAKFFKSEYYKELTPVQKENADAIIFHFTDYMYSYLGVAPEEWNEYALEECCLDILPRKITAEEDYFKSVAPVLAAFFKFLDAQNLLKHTLSLAKRVEEINDKIIERANDSSNWGMAKTFAMAALKAGVNLEDQEELERFRIFWNMQLQKTKSSQKSLARHKAKRNAPCPCGSGKKYKNCCGR